MSKPTRVRLPAWRYGRVVAIAVIVAIGVNLVVWAVADWHLADMHVYQDAAMRVRDGEALYGGDVDALNAYRYAPWFAYAWVPITYLPQPVINLGWSAVLLVASAVAVGAAARTPGSTRWLVVMLMAPILFGISAGGNVQGPMLALLMLGVPRRWAGMAIGVAASLKVVPLLLMLILLAQRRWWQAVAACATAALLWLPVAWMDADPVTFDPGLARTLPEPAWMATALVAASVASVLALRRSRYAAVAASTAAVLALPRLFVYEITLLLTGMLAIRDTR